MAHIILAETTASISELKKNPMGAVAAGDGFPVAILNRNDRLLSIASRQKPTRLCWADWKTSN